MNAITPTQLRQNLYSVLDEVLETGVAQDIVRNGRKLRIVPAEPRRRSFEAAPKRQALNCTFDELVETSWEAKRQGISFAELCRQAVGRILRRKAPAEKPWMRYAGIIEDDAPQASQSVDEVVYGCETLIRDPASGVDSRNVLR